ncbi:MAG: tRNA(fMet)-specific endonuclease VapC [Chroococcidiopsis sp. SAG 2025]|uniref:type II toxin-antitoxin system VapC family toxin n=1 Tax=Chroococcidiopsis sp. SAG 2025 TaxID=171389 RepID=UPI002936E36D|nr:PIN domain-containing protein [Chroococcidiopsis sp. SAG 2025]MDV2995423.1 tRNA(fMet)-specific endonuclease VapC [Chroococcidiopsis sp. SAG 2025]
MRVLFDTSVLVAAILVSHPQHPACFARLKAAESRQVLGFVSTHSLAEIYSVMTRLPVQPRITPHQAQSAIADVSQYLEIVPLLSDEYLAAIAQMVAINVPGGGIFDALIAQAALKAHVNILLTLNPNHFTRLGNAIANLVQVPK